MQIKIAIWCIFSLTVLLLMQQTQAQISPQDRQLCQRLLVRCAASAPQLANNDVDGLNLHCRRKRGSRWRSVTRCQIIRAVCENALYSCEKFTCQFIAKVNGLA